MKYYVDICVKDLPTTTVYATAADDFEEMPIEQGDLLLASEPNFVRGICFRDGRYYKGQNNQIGPGDVCTLVFDDFEPGMMLKDNPEWYDLLKDRIVVVQAQEGYGPDQGIAVNENITYGSAVARIRNQLMERGGMPVIVVKITATGPASLEDARILHSMILEGSQ